MSTGSKSVSVFHVIVSLEIGGAELMLKRLVESTPENIMKTVVISLTSLGEVGVSLRASGVCVYTLGMKSALDFPISLWRLIRLIKKYRPSVLQTWMYHSDFLGGIAARLAGSCHVVWNVRGTAIPQGALSITYWLVRVCAVCSYFIPDRIICCSNSAKIAHINLRFDANKMVVVPNGYDFSAFKLHAHLRERVRLKLDLTNADIVICVVGRFDPLKDFHNFVTAASCIYSKRNYVKFLMVGRGNEWSNATLRDWIEDAGMVQQFRLVGHQTDIPYYLSAVDIFCLSSVHEAFPNVVVEAMAMGLPCVVTRAGDAAEILGDEVFVVPTRDSHLLADALMSMCEIDPVDRKMLGERNAKKVREDFGIEKIRLMYEAVYDEVLRK